MGAIGHNSQKAQSIVRSNPEYGFTKLSNAFLQDSRVSYETRGLLAELMSRPDDWEITVANIVKSGPAGRDKVYRMMKEAEKFGYAVTRKDRGMDGAFRKHDYRISDDPQLLIERAAAELDKLLPENPEVAEPDTVVPFPAKAEVVSRQAISGKPVSGQPLPEKPYTAQPLPGNPQQTNKRELQRKETTKENSPAREDGFSKIASALAAGIAATVAPVGLAAGPAEPTAQVMQDVAECWQTPRARMDAATNIDEMRAQKQVWIVGTGVLDVAGDFKAELGDIFPLVDLRMGLAVAAAYVQKDLGALQAMRKIRERFAYLQSNAAERQKREASWAKAKDGSNADDPAAKYRKFYDGVL